MVCLSLFPYLNSTGKLSVVLTWDLKRLEDKVIDMEVAAGTPSPTVDPSVRTVLIGHSMGGIVAAETVIGLASDKPIVYSEDGIVKPDGDAP